jgi:hypothetical protein
MSGAFFEVSDGTRTRDRLDHNHQELYQLTTPKIDEQPGRLSHEGPGMHVYASAARPLGQRPTSPAQLARAEFSGQNPRESVANCGIGQHGR